MQRKLVTVQTINKIVPAQNADALDVATVLGWNVVVRKGQFNIGDKIAFFEVDSMLPANDERYTDFMKHGTKTIAIDGKDFTGFVVRSIKLRGNLSQGLIMPLDELIPNGDTFSVGDEITDLCGVVKFDPPLPNSPDIIGPFTDKVSKTDSIRLQSIVENWDKIKGYRWQPTIKVDGSSHTITHEADGFHLFSRNYEITTDGSAVFKILERDGILDAIEPNMVVQFEHAGQGVQNNRLRLTGQRVFIFNVFIDGIKVPFEQWPAGLQRWAVPQLDERWSLDNFDTPEQLINDVAQNLSGYVTKGLRDEGIVYHLVDETFNLSDNTDWMDSTLNFKVINNGYLLKHGL